MPKKKPKVHNSHQNSKKAKANLQSIFPENWQIATLEDESSGIEYGQDFMIQIVEDDGQITGAEFRIQSKVFSTEKRTKGKRLKDKINITTLNYLSEIQIPVMLHYYDSIDDVGYWIWLDEWYSENYSISWEKQSTKSVPITKSKNELNAKSLAKIKARAFAEQRKNLLRKLAESESKHNPHYSFPITFLDGQQIVSIQPKHDKALDEHPIGVNLHLDDKHFNRLSEAQKKGIPTTLEGVISTYGLPDWMPLAESEYEMLIQLIPHVPDEVMNLKIEAFDSDSQSLFVSEYVPLRLSQYGQELQIWKGESKTQALIYTLTIRFIPEDRKWNLNINFEINLSNRIPRNLQRGLEIAKLLSKVRLMRIKNLESGFELALPEINNIEESDYDQIIIDFIENLAFISKMLSVDFLVPDDITEHDMLLAKKLSLMLKTGKSKSYTMLPVREKNDIVIILHLGKTIGENLLDEFNNQDKLSIFVGNPENLSTELLGQTINLGLVRQMVYLDELLKTEPLVNSEDKLVEIVFSIHHDKSEIHLLDWSEQANEIIEIGHP